MRYPRSVTILGRVLLLVPLAAAACENTATSSAPAEPAEPPARGAGAGRMACDEAPPPPPPPDAHTGTLVPARHPDRVPCESLQDGSAGALCVAGFDGPMVVTDLEFGSDCPDELMVLAGSVAQPQWFIANPPHSHLSVHGAALVVPPTLGLVFAARSVNGSPPTLTARCFVTWSWTGRANRHSAYEWDPSGL